MPKPRVETVRGELREVLTGEKFWTLSELSTWVGVSERELPEHLRHLERTVRRDDERLEVDPPQCAKCGFAFEGRTRFTKPGKCPECRGTRIDPPAVRITAK